VLYDASVERLHQIGGWLDDPTLENIRYTVTLVLADVPAQQPDLWADRVGDVLNEIRSSTSSSRSTPPQRATRRWTNGARSRRSCAPAQVPLLRGGRWRRLLDRRAARRTDRWLLHRLAGHRQAASGAVPHPPGIDYPRRDAGRSPEALPHPRLRVRRSTLCGSADWRRCSFTPTSPCLRDSRRRSVGRGRFLWRRNDITVWSSPFPRAWSIDTRFGSRR
jgi:hypothetical protein